MKIQTLNRTLRQALPAGILVLLASCGGNGEKKADMKTKINYPVSEKGTQSDDYHGTRVNDPYRWLENDTAANVKAWVEAQNKTTFGYLAGIPFRDKIKERLTGLMNYPKYYAPEKAGDYFFFTRNDGLQNQGVIMIQKGMDGEPKLFLDPNKMSADGTAAVALISFSHDKKYVAYSVNQSGSDWQNIYVMEVATQKKLSDELTWVKFGGAAWQGNGFYYSRYDEPKKGKEFSNTNEYQQIYFHRLGEPQSKDELIYKCKVAKQYVGAQVTQDERFLILYLSAGTQGTEVSFRDLKKGQKDFTLLFPGFEHDYTVIDNDGDRLLVETNDGAANKRILSVDTKNHSRENWKDLIPEKPELIASSSTAGGKLFVNYLQDVSSHVYQYTLGGILEHEIQLPALGSADGFNGYSDDKYVFFLFSSFMYPPSIFKYDIATGISVVWHKSEVKFNTGDYETKQVFYPSKDGTKIPMFLVFKKGIKLDGTNPTLLYGYGGFSVSLSPFFSVSNIVLLENGGIYALANIRGGLEYGEKWHTGGNLLNKQNVFDDFIAAGEYLIKEKYTSSEKLAIEGGSNGGLLVGACMTQRPELFKVAFPEVGVLDMLRFHKFTVGWGWVTEYGSSDDSKFFKYLYGYSPLHNVKEVAYPATLVMTADHDDRVVPAHSFKFIATLQEKNKGDNPVLIRIATKAGHGAGKPTSKIIEEQADKWSFMFFNMNVTPVYP
ncbi:MAG TPA: prolyl oligopeptidase family serine peptidase [Bacteroidia bacterium]|jgi:prolyl oligopeptidase|nr:prolyl oligopeptidase family serine peptidase [Bacteroidia bacterium]